MQRRRHQRRHKICVAFFEERDRFVVQHVAVFDGIDAAAKRIANSLRSDRMRAHRQPVAMRLGAGCGHLFRRELRKTGNGAFGENAAGRDEFDAVRTGEPLLSDGFARIPWPVDGAPNRPAVAAGHAQHVAGGAHARAGQPAAIDRLAKFDRDAVRAAQIAHGRYAGHE